MFSQVIDLIVINGFINKGVAFELDKKFYLSDNTMIGYDDYAGNYFFAVKDKVETDKDSCVELRLSQKFNFKFITNCPYSLWLTNALNSLYFADTTNINGIRGMIGSVNEVKLNDKLFLNEIEFTFNGTMNDCDVELPCCC
jgi:hypothetical protein